MPPYILYAMPGSLYSGKARAYLRKQRVEFIERAPSHPGFDAARRAVGRWIIPVLETPDGGFIQDGADIITHGETAGWARLPALAGGPVQRVVGAIFELFGGEGMVRPAMHYRWDFDADNLGFLAQDFSGPMVLEGGAEARAASFAASSARMRQAARIFGVSEDSAPVIEASYARFLQLFEAHLETTPYLLGGAPTLGDYGLFAPLHAHLARDPHPATLMKTTAWRVWRWVERMYAPNQDAGEYGDVAEVVFAADAVPDTLKALLAFVAEDYLPEVEAFMSFYNGVAAGPDIVAGEVIGGRASQRVIGFTAFDWRGVKLSVAVFPYRVWLLQKIQDLFDGLAAADQAQARALLAEVGLARLVDLRPTRRVERVDNREVWGALTS
ncbi:glutathione S-transferase N-terminal domain-containing protein [Phenylobacterium aquaticum]|uniref:glutathione S-transferase C-terminal domain-containing protein n=1 Tax=Phenylobacterium aquaticum TaxID=1763816 RepID=UPI0026F085C2|nr:glutathione S-transferase N-terminal domain-containing protein [Phenylobacterium aquaticum]